jgi:hypothetical protein
MTEPINITLRREVKRAVAETLQQGTALHPCLSINKAAGIAMARAHIPAEDRPKVVHEVCREGLRLRVVLEFS